ncbi:MAG: fibronectin type III domain-containing protein, partial [Thermoguttaceae bacterium]|nr:fibronectin type III domain-containing protein [Thermoguttaceae bacterium]
PTPLDVPTFKSSSSTSDSITVTWNAVANASGYVLEYKSASDTDYTVIPATTATTIMLRYLPAETTYKFRLYAVGDGTIYSNSGYSAVKAVKTKARPVETPSTTVTTIDDVVDAYDGKISLREAITLYSADGDTIDFAPALKGATITLGGSEISIEKSLKIDASALWNETEDAPGITIDADSKSRIFTIAGEDVEFKSLTFTGGNAGNYSSGGAIYAGSSTTVTIVNASFRQNRAGRGGGAIQSYGEVVVNSSVFIGNEAIDGGAVYCDDANLTIEGSVFTGNSASSLGGAVYSRDGANGETYLTVKDSCFTENNANVGGAIFSGSSRIESSTISGNTAHTGAGIALGAKNGSSVLINLIIVDNVASYNGGAICVSDDGSIETQIENSLIARNIAAVGGGLYLMRVETTLRNSTITNNSCSDRGGGIWLSNGGVLNVYNSIIAANTAAEGADVIQHSSQSVSSQSAAWNVLSGYTAWNSGANQLTYDPNQPLFANAEEGDYSLTSGSQAINRGNNEYVSTDVDLAGNARILGGTVDLGAYEFDAPEPTPLDVPTFKSSSSTTDSVTVAWNAVANASGYVVEYKSASDSGYTVMPQTTMTTITIPNLASETTYKFRLYAVGDGTTYADSGYSAVKAVKTKAASVDPTPLDVPTFKSSSSTSDSVTITWNAVANATGYVVEYKSASDSGYTVMPQTTATTITIPNLASETTYKFRLYAVGDGTIYVDSGYSAVKAVKTKARQLETPATTVTTSDDVVDAYDGKISLREAITLYSADGDTIDFALTLKGATITLGGSEIEINKSLRIDASALWDATEDAPGITIDADSHSRIFYIARGTAEIDSLAFTGGAASDFGGAIYLYYSSSATIFNSRFNNNTAPDGGAIYVPRSSLTLDNCNFCGNNASRQSGDGGAILANYSSTVTISRSAFDGNTSGYGGGAISAYNGTTLTIIDSRFDANVAGYTGGAIDANAAAFVTISNSILNANTAPVWGGAISAVIGSTASISNSILTQNKARLGSAIYLSHSSTSDRFLNGRLFNVTIADNSATDSSGGAIHIRLNSEMVVYNTIVANNQNGDVSLDGNVAVNAHNVLSGYADWSNADAVAWAYDPSQPLFANAAEGDYSLADGSQALNLGNNEYVSTDVDLAGNARIIGGTVDLGAYERQNEASSLTVSSYNATTRQAVLIWDANPDATTYKLQISKDGGATWTNYKTGLSTRTATVNGLYVGKTYGFRVYGISSSGASLPGYYETTFSPSADSNALLDEAFADFFEETFFEF